MRKQWISYFCALLAVVALLAVNIGQIIPQKENAPTMLSALPRPGYGNPTRMHLSNAYDEQIACTFTQNVPSLSYTITAVAQSGTDGYGPAYLVNGLGNTGYWYQVGLSYNWNLGAGFQLNYEVFDPSDNSVFPTNGEGGLATFSPVNPGDTVLLSLTFSSGEVIMQGTDQNTGAHAQETYSAEGATTFVGNPSAVANPAGFWTGLMTEWYHTAAYTGGEQAETYIDNGPAIASAWIWIEEIAVSQSGNITGDLFSDSTPSPFTFANSAQLQSFSSNGATAAINGTQFITGGQAGASSVALTFEYSVVGGAGTSSAPVLSYISGGVPQTANLTQSNQTFSIDSGSTWSITNPLTSSTSTERWQTSQTTTGTTTASQTIDFVYYHQYLVTTNLNPSAGGAVSVGGGWFDAGASYQPVATANSGWQFEGWSGSGDGSYTGSNDSASIVVSAPMTETATFYPGLTITARAGRPYHIPMVRSPARFRQEPNEAFLLRRGPKFN